MDSVLHKIIPTLRWNGPLGLLRKTVHFLTRRERDLAIPLAIAQIRALRDRSVDQTLDFAEIAFAGLIQPQQQRQEFLELLHLLEERRPRTILEIGTAGGGTLFCLTRVSTDEALLISIDIPGGYRSYRIPLYRSFARAKQQVRLVQADSHDQATADLVSGDLDGRPVDFLFIDGDHTYDSVKRDFQLYGPMVKPGGMIGFHDINLGDRLFGGGSKVFWREVKDRYPSQELLADPSIEQFGIGLLFVE